LHITPTSASWLNLIERLFAEVTSGRAGGRYRDQSRSAQQSAQALCLDQI
jgi:hypothetical protein